VAGGVDGIASIAMSIWLFVCFSVRSENAIARALATIASALAGALSCEAINVGLEAGRDVSAAGSRGIDRFAIFEA
jgi:hypothetical protein